MENKQNIHIERLEKLKQATIINFTEDINYNDKIGLYDTLLENLFNGNFNDDVFLTTKLDDLTDEEKTGVFDLANKYNSLCFFEGDSSYWIDSIEGVSLNDPDLVCIKLLDNYDFLLGLSKDGEDCLKALVELKNTNTFEQKVIIDYLRNVFINDEVLKDTLKRIDGEYSDFTSEQKAMLCLYPEGLIYKVNRNDNSIERIPASKLISEIKINLLGEDNENFNLGDSLKHLSVEDFDEIINKVYDAYREENNISIK